MATDSYAALNAFRQINPAIITKMDVSPFLAVYRPSSLSQAAFWTVSFDIWWSGLVTSGMVPFSKTSHDETGLVNNGFGEKIWKSEFRLRPSVTGIVFLLLEEIRRFDTFSTSDSKVLLCLGWRGLACLNSPDQRFRMSGFATHWNKNMERPCRLTATVNKYWTGRDALSNMNRPVIQVKPRRDANAIDLNKAILIAEFCDCWWPAPEIEVFDILWER